MTNKKSRRDWTIFMNINDERYSDVERMTAIEHIAYAPTHNSITKAMMLDVIRYLLTAQQPRVLTLEEALGLDEDLCWIEINVDGADRNFGRWNDLYVAPDGISIVSEWAGQKNYLDAERYGKTWRCWTAKPTDEQRKATPWNEPPKEGDGE